METQVTGETKSLAKRSLVLGLISIGLLIINFMISAYARTLPSIGLQGPQLQLFFLSACLVLVSIILVIWGFLAGLIATIRNKGDDSAKRIAIIGMVLNIASVLGFCIVISGW